MNGKDLAEKLKLIINDKKLVKVICNNLKYEKVGTEKEIKKVYSLL